MKSIYPEYAEQVNFFSIAVSKSFDNLDRLENQRQKQGYPWPVANIVEESHALSALNVSYQSTKIAFDSRGVITYRDGFGGGSSSTWHQVFSDLASQ
ncbi:MAG: hypothetical protein OXI91_02060 [Chloroflexota bacterium]|nr:hypothetical protein [Chloroflexota bacterium]